MTSIAKWYPTYSLLSENDKKILQNISYSNLEFELQHAEEDDGGITFNVVINTVKICIPWINFPYFIKIINAKASIDNFKVLQEVLQLEKKEYEEWL